jgi:hypothetical protein
MKIVSIIIPSLREEHCRELIGTIDVDAQVIVKDTPGGSLNGIREGYKEATGEYVIFVPDDIRFRRGSLANIIEFLKRKDGLVQASFVLPENNMLASIRGFGFARWSCMRRDLIESVGGLMRDGYKHHYGDTDLSMRVLKAGGSVEACPGAVIDSLCIEDDVYIQNNNYLKQDKELFNLLWPGMNIK